MPHYVTLIPGDGIGPEVANAATRVVDAVGVDVHWDRRVAGLQAIEEYGNALPKKTLESIRSNQVALKGPTTTPIGKGHRSVNVLLRQELDLFACIRPVKSIPGVRSRYSDVDLVVIRENTEGLYCGQELEISRGVVISMKVATENACLRIAREAFLYASQNHRKHVTAAHKANIIKLGDGLFLDCMQRVARDYPQVFYDETIIDALCMKLVIDPNQFDVLLLENLYGDIVSDLCAGLVGGLGLVPSANIGKNAAIFEAVHGSAPDIIGKQIANPTALIKSAALMIEHLGYWDRAQTIHRAIEKVIQKGTYLTADLGGNASTNEFTDAVIHAL